MQNFKEDFPASCVLDIFGATPSGSLTECCEKINQRIVAQFVFYL